MALLDCRFKYLLFPQDCGSVNKLTTVKNQLMEKQEKLTKLYLILILIVGITIGYLDAKEIDPIYLIVCGIGMVCVSILVGSALEVSYSALFKKKNERNSILKFNESEIKVISNKNRFKFGFLFALSILIFAIFLI